MICDVDVDFKIILIDNCQNIFHQNMHFEKP